MKKLLLWALTGICAGNAMAVVPKQSLFSDVLIHKPEAIDADKLAIAEKIISSEKRRAFCQAMIDLYYVGKLTMHDMHDMLDCNMITYMESKNIPINGITLFGSFWVSLFGSMGLAIRKNFGNNNDDNKHITEDAIKKIINADFNTTDRPLTSDEILSITEILKERKNQLVQEMHDEMWKQIHTPSMGDIVTEDYALLSMYGLGLFFLRIPFVVAQDPHLWGFQRGIGFSMAAVCLHHLCKYRYEIRSREAEMDKFDIIIKKIESFDDVFTQQLSDQCDLWIEDAQLSNSFAAKQQIIQNMYAYLDTLSEKESSEKLKVIRSKVDKAIENLAAQYQVSVKDLKG